MYFGKFWSCLQNSVADKKEPVVEKASGLAPDQKERREHQLQKQVYLSPPWSGLRLNLFMAVAAD